MKSPTEEFNRNSRKYKCYFCCCGLVHVQTAAWRICILSAFFVFLDLIYTIVDYQDSISLAMGIFTLAIGIIAEISLFIALERRSYHFMALTIVGEILLLLFITIFIGCLLIMYILPESAFGKTLLNNTSDFLGLSKKNSRMAQITLGAHIFFQSLMFCLLFYFLTILKQCYTFYKDYKEYRIARRATAVMGPSQL